MKIKVKMKMMKMNSTYESLGNKKRGRIKETGLDDIRFNSPCPISPPRQFQFTSGATARRPSIY